MNTKRRSTANSLPDNAESDCVPLYRFWQPRYWLIWAGLGILRLIILLPFRVQLWVGGLLGKLLFAIEPKRRRIAQVNLQLCFPELDDAAQRRLLRAHGSSLGFSVFEVGLALWGGEARVDKLVTLKGIENLTAPLERGQGVIILSGHFPAIELVGRIARKSLPDMGAMYRPLRNPLIDQLLRRARAKATSPLIPKDGVRQMIRLLRKGAPVWYASDQSYDGVNAELVPFFNEPAMTNAALSHIVRMGKACVVPFFQRRLADGSGYEGTFFPALENFPTDDQAADAERVNEILAKWIRTAPEQYYWVHRRFKNRPEPYPDPYRDL